MIVLKKTGWPPLPHLVASLFMLLLLIQLSGMWWHMNTSKVPRDVDTTPVNMNETNVKGEHQTLGPQRDGTFNGINMYLRTASDSFHSETRCVGDNFRENSWQSRSCEFRNLCFNTETKKFVVFRSPRDRALSDQEDKGATFSTTLSNKSVALGSFTSQQIKYHGFEKMKWFPEIVDDIPQEYYELPSDYIFVPFHGLAPHNPGHLIWDNLLPIHILLSTFQLQSSRLLLMRVVLDGQGLFGTCEAENIEWMARVCEKTLHRFLPMMGVGVNESFSTNNNFEITPKETKSKYICATKGVAGIGMMTDHGLGGHGFDESDYDNSRFAGRAPLIYSFRSFAMDNMGFISGANVVGQAPFRITFSIRSSRSSQRDTSFTTPIKTLKEAYKGNEAVVIQSFHFVDLSEKEQIEIASKTDIFISAVGGGAATITFLPRGASAILYYPKTDGVQTRLDWEILNNAGYFNTHWLDIRKRNTEKGLAQLLGIIDSEIDRIAHF